MDLTDSEFVRMRSLGYRIKQPTNKADSTLLMELNQIKLELNRIGVNFNQHTKHANAGRELPALFYVILTQIQKVTQDTSKLINRVGQKYGD